jgi:large subunit ribosomal protein L13
VLGRVATLAARLLQGKHKAVYTPHIDTGDHVVVVNAGTVKLTGRKEDQRSIAATAATKAVCARSAQAWCASASRCGSWKRRCAACCPRRRWAIQMYRKLKVYARADHPHTAQQPAKIEVQ